MTTIDWIAVFTAGAMCGALGWAVGCLMLRSFYKKKG